MISSIFRCGYVFLKTTSRLSCRERWISFFRHWRQLPSWRRMVSFTANWIAASPTCNWMLPGLLYNTSGSRTGAGHELVTETPTCLEVSEHTTLGLLDLGAIFNTLSMLRPSQNSRHFPDYIFKCIDLNENVWISLKFGGWGWGGVVVGWGGGCPINIGSWGGVGGVQLTLVQIMVWRRPGDKPLAEPMMVSLLMHIYICVSRSQWVKPCHYNSQLI